MSKRIGSLAVLSVTAVFIAFIALITASSVDTDQAQAGPSHTFHGYCVSTNSSGGFSFYHVTSHDVGGSLPSKERKEEFCEDEKDGAHVTSKQKSRIQGVAQPGTLETTNTSVFPDGWFEAPTDCLVLPNTGDASGVGDDGQNRLQHLKQKETLELALQIVYDVGSNEISGILGAVLGTLLGATKVNTYGLEWVYELQDECQEIFERNTIQDINVDTEAIVSDVQALLLDAATHSSQTSVDALSTDVGAVNTKVIEISTALTALAGSLTTETNEIDGALVVLATSLATETGEIDATLVILAASLTTQTDEIDAALAVLATSLATETDEIDTALAALAASLTTETDEIDAALAALSLQLAGAQDQSVRLYIEDHLDTCRSLVSLLLDDADGLLPLLVLVVDDLATRAEAAGWNIGNARQHIASADTAFANGDAGKGFQSLCTAYGKIVIGS